MEQARQQDLQKKKDAEERKLKLEQEALERFRKGTGSNFPIVGPEDFASHV